MTNAYGRVIAQAVNRRFPTAKTLIRSQIRSFGICGGERGTGAGFSEVMHKEEAITVS
jgi:hypothetical protein